MLLLCCYHCDCVQQHHDVTQFEYVLWCHTMHEWVINIHYQTWIAQEQFINIILTPSKQWGVCDNHVSKTENNQTFVLLTLCSKAVHYSFSPGTRRTNNILLECEIQWNYAMLFFITYLADPNEILHTPWQCNYLDICKNFIVIGWSYLKYFNLEHFKFLSNF